MHLDHYSAAESGHTIGSSSTNPSDKPLVRKWSEPCQNWNKGVCMRRKNCHYLYVCKRWFKKGHISDKYPSKGTLTSSQLQSKMAKLGLWPHVE